MVVHVGIDHPELFLLDVVLVGEGLEPQGGDHSQRVHQPAELHEQALLGGIGLEDVQLGLDLLLTEHDAAPVALVEGIEAQGDGDYVLVGRRLDDRYRPAGLLAQLAHRADHHQVGQVVLGVAALPGQGEDPVGVRPADGVLHPLGLTIEEGEVLVADLPAFGDLAQPAVDLDLRGLQVDLAIGGAPQAAHRLAALVDAQAGVFLGIHLGHGRQPVPVGPPDEPPALVVPGHPADHSGGSRLVVLVSIDEHGIARRGQDPLRVHVAGSGADRPVHYSVPR